MPMGFGPTPRIDSAILDALATIGLQVDQPVVEAERGQWVEILNGRKNMTKPKGYRVGDSRAERIADF